MYFYLRKSETEAGADRILFGPFLLPRNALISRHEDTGNRRQLSEQDYENLMAATEEMTFYQCPFKSLDIEVEFRDELSSIEYEEACTINKGDFSLEQWFDYLHINRTKHANYLTGRSKVDGLMASKIIDLFTPHSYILERTAFAISNYQIGNVAVKDLSMKEFGQSSIEMRDAINNGRDILLSYYWARRSHVDLMQTYIYIHTAEERENNDRVFSEWYRCPEYDAFTALGAGGTKKAKANKAKALSIIKLIKAYKESEFTDAQRESTQAMIQDGLALFGHTGSALSSDEALKFMEDILGIRYENEGYLHKGFTHASAGVLYPTKQDPSHEELGFTLMD